jgi:hypothetical protein
MTVGARTTRRDRPLTAPTATIHAIATTAINTVTATATVETNIKSVTATRIADTAIRSVTMTTGIAIHVTLTAIIALLAASTGAADPIHHVAPEDRTRKTHAGKAVLPPSAATPIQDPLRAIPGTVSKKSNLKVTTNVSMLPKHLRVLHELAAFRIILQTGTTR